MGDLNKPDVDEVKFWYTNHRGETALRRVLPLEIWFGKTEHHPKEQWLLKAFDLDREADRDFALSEVKDWRPA